MRYAVEGDDLVIRIALDAIAQNAMTHGDAVAKVKDKAALAMALGRELIECEDVSEQLYISGPLDAAIERVIESADPSLDYNDWA